MSRIDRCSRCAGVGTLELFNRGIGKALTEHLHDTLQAVGRDGSFHQQGWTRDATEVVQAAVRVVRASSRHDSAMRWGNPPLPVGVTSGFGPCGYETGVDRPAEWLPSHAGDRGSAAGATARKCQLMSTEAEPNSGLGRVCWKSVATAD
jgi:hypothetical protein